MRFGMNGQEAIIESQKSETPHRFLGSEHLVCAVTCSVSALPEEYEKIGLGCERLQVCSYSVQTLR